MNVFKQQCFRILLLLLVCISCQFFLPGAKERVAGHRFISLLGVCVNVAQAQNADSNSGDNYVPEKSTTIRQQADSRWVIYDRGDQTDWLRVTPTNDETLQSVTRLNFTRVEGRVLLEVYGDDPYGEVLEHKIFTEAQEYSYVSSSLSTRYFKLYAESSGSLAKYEFSYELHPVPSPTPAATPEVVPTSKPGPESTATAMPTETPTATPSPIPTATATPTELPTAPPSPAPTATSTPTATPSPIPTATATPTELPTATQSPTPTATFTPTTTPTETPTTTPSPAPTATATPTAAPTATPTKTLSPEPTAPLTATAIPTVTLGPAPTATATPTATPTITPAASAVSTSTPDLPTTATATPLPSATPTETASPMPTPVVSSISSEDGSDVDSSPTSASTPQTLNLALLIAVIICLIVIVTLSILLLLARKRLARLDKPVTDMLRASDYKQLGQFAAEQGKTHLAERCYRKMVAQEPYNWNIRYELGIFFFQTERYSEAIKELSLYLKSDIIDSAVYGYLAYAYLATENWAKAEEWYKKALEVKPEDPYAYFGLGVIAQSRAQYAQADQLYHQSLELDPGLEEARENLRQIQPYL